jgi:predicted transcriptional regulator of viral defense system
MTRLDQFLQSRMAQGLAWFTRHDAAQALGVSNEALTMALVRYTKKSAILSAWRGFYLILRPEDRVFGAPDPARWIDPLFTYLATDYRISLLRAAAFHGASHQAAMVFQVIAPKQLRSFDLGRHRIEFIYQNAALFDAVNRSAWLASLKTDTGYAKVAGVELTLLDCARYFHQVGGLSSVAQIVQDIGRHARPRRLAQLAKHYEETTIRRLGYLLSLVGHQSQAKVLLPLVSSGGSAAPLNPAIVPPPSAEPPDYKIDRPWRLILNEPVELDF